MKKKRFKAEEIVNTLREADVLISQDRTVVQVCRHPGQPLQSWMSLSSVVIQRFSVSYAWIR